MKKYFAPDIDDEFCYELKDIKEMAKDLEISSLKVIEAERITGDVFFYCTHFNEVGEVGEGCGKMCDAYKPRNGKNGRCVHSGHCYERTENARIITIK